MSTSSSPQFGRIWFNALNTSSGDTSGSLLTGTTSVSGETAHLAAIVPDPGSRFPRARNGEVGIQEAMALAEWVNSLKDDETPLILIIDVPSQAYGYFEELLGINFALAASTDAIAHTRLSGRPVIAFIVGKAISGAFLATGLQANRIVSLDHPGVQVQVMSKQAAARITQRSVEDLDRLAETIPAMAFDVHSFNGLGAVNVLFTVSDPASPTPEDVQRTHEVLAAARAEIRTTGDTGLVDRLKSAGAVQSRGLSTHVREQINAHW